MECRPEASLQSATQAAQTLSGAPHFALWPLTFAPCMFQKLQRSMCCRGKHAGSSCRTSQSLRTMCELAKASAKSFSIPQLLAIDVRGSQRDRQKHPRSKALGEFQN